MRGVNGVAEYPVGRLKTMQQIMAPVAFRTVVILVHKVFVECFKSILLRTRKGRGGEEGG